MTLWRLVLGILVAILLVGAVVSWSRSRLAMDILTHRYGELRKPGEDLEDPDLYTYTARTIGLSHRRGRIGLMFTSAKHRDVSPAMQGQTSVKPWEAITVPLILVSPEPDRGYFEYKSAADWNILGVRMTSSTKDATQVWTFGAPHWMVCTILAASLTKLLVIPWLRWRRGRCPKCAYNLKQIPDHRCPSCGWDRGERTEAPAAAPQRIAA